MFERASWPLDLLPRLDGSAAREREPGSDTRVWDRQRLRAALINHQRGERVIMLANREPWLHEKTPDGIKVLHPASGLVTALLTATDFPRGGLRWVEMDDNFSLHNLLIGLLGEPHLRKD